MHALHELGDLADDGVLIDQQPGFEVSSDELGAGVKALSEGRDNREVGLAGYRTAAFSASPYCLS